MAASTSITRKSDEPSLFEFIPRPSPKPHSHTTPPKRHWRPRARSRSRDGRTSRSRSSSGSSERSSREPKKGVPDATPTGNADLMANLSKLLGLKGTSQEAGLAELLAAVEPKLSPKKDASSTSFGQSGHEEIYNAARASMIRHEPFLNPRTVQPKKPDFGYSLDRRTMNILGALPSYLHICRESMYYSIRELSLSGRSELTSTIYPYCSFRAPDSLAENLYNSWNPQLMRRVQEKFNFKLEHIVWLQKILVDAQLPLRRPVGLIHFDNSVQEQVEVAVILELVDQVLMPSSHQMRPNFEQKQYTPRLRKPGTLRSDIRTIRYLDTPPPSPPPRELTPPARRRTPDITRPDNSHGHVHNSCRTERSISPDPEAILRENLLEYNRIQENRVRRVVSPLRQPFPMPSDTQYGQYQPPYSGQRSPSYERSTPFHGSRRSPLPERRRSPFSGRSPSPHQKRQRSPRSDVMSYDRVRPGSRHSLESNRRSQDERSFRAQEDSSHETSSEKRRRITKLVDAIFETIENDPMNAALQLLDRTPRSRELLIELALRQSETLTNLAELIKDRTLQPHSRVIVEFENSLLKMALETRRSRSRSNSVESKRPKRLKRKREKSSSSSSSSEDESTREKERKVEEIMSRVEELRKKMMSKLVERTPPCAVLKQEENTSAPPVNQVSKATLPSMIVPPPIVPPPPRGMAPPLVPFLPGTPGSGLPVLTSVPPPPIVARPAGVPPLPALPQDPPSEPQVSASDLKTEFWNYFVEYALRNRSKGNSVCETACTAFLDLHIGFKFAKKEPSFSNCQWTFMLAFGLSTANGSGKNVQEAFLEALLLTYGKDKLKEVFSANLDVGYLLFGTDMPEKLGLQTGICVQSFFAGMHEYLKLALGRMTTSKDFINAVNDFVNSASEYVKISQRITQFHKHAPPPCVTEIEFKFSRTPVKAIGRASTQIDSLVDAFKSAFGFKRLKTISGGFWEHISSELRNWLQVLDPEERPPQPHVNTYWPTYFVTKNCVPSRIYPSPSGTKELFEMVDDSCSQVAMYIRSFMTYKPMLMVAFKGDKEQLAARLSDKRDSALARMLLESFMAVAKHYLLFCCQPVAPNPGLRFLVAAIKSVVGARKLWGDPCVNSLHSVLFESPPDDVVACLRGLLADRVIIMLVDGIECSKVDPSHPSYKYIVPKYFSNVVNRATEHPTVAASNDSRKMPLLASAVGSTQEDSEKGVPPSKRAKPLLADLISDLATSSSTHESEPSIPILPLFQKAGPAITQPDKELSVSTPIFPDRSTILTAVTPTPASSKPVPLFPEKPVPLFPEKHKLPPPSVKPTSGAQVDTSPAAPVTPAAPPIPPLNPYRKPDSFIEKRLISGVKDYFSYLVGHSEKNQLLKILVDVPEAKTHFVTALAGNETLLMKFFDDANHDDKVCRGILLELPGVQEKAGNIVIKDSVSDFVENFVTDAVPLVEPNGPMKTFCSKYDMKHLRLMLKWYCFLNPDKCFTILSGMSSLVKSTALSKVGSDEVKLAYALMHIAKELKIPEMTAAQQKQASELEAKIDGILKFTKSHKKHPISALLSDFAYPKAALGKIASHNRLLLDNLKALAGIAHLTEGDSSVKQLSFKISALNIERVAVVESRPEDNEGRNSPNAEDVGRLIDGVFSVLNTLDSKANALVNFLKTQPTARLVFTQIALVDKPLLANLVEKVQWPVFRQDDPDFMKMEAEFKKHIAEEEAQSAPAHAENGKPMDAPVECAKVEKKAKTPDRLDQKHKQIEQVIDQICIQQKSNPVIKIISEKGDPKKILWDIAINRAASLQKIVAVIRGAKSGTVNQATLRADVDAVLRECSS